MSARDLLRRARELWPEKWQQRAWVRSVLRLGDRWLLAQPIRRGQT